MAGRLSNPNQQFFDENGEPLDGGQLEFFATGTSTPQDTFSDDGLTVANTNPVILDSAGRAGDIFLTTADYKVVLKKSDDTVVWTADPVRAPTPKSTVVVDVSAATTVDTGDDGSLYAADATSGAFLITLPAAADAGDGFELSVIKVDSTTNTVTVDADGSETINGQLDYDLLTQYATVTLRCDGSTWYVTAESVSRNNSPLDPLHINGYDISNGSTPATDIDIAAGTCRSDDDTANIILTSGLTKILNAAFAEGTNQGCLDTGSVAADSVYDLYAISKDDGTADVVATLKGSGPSLPSGFTKERFIGRIPTGSGGNIDEDQICQQRIDGQYYEAILDTSSGGAIAVKALPDEPAWVSFGVSEVSGDAGVWQLQVQIGGDTSIETTGYTGRVTNFSASAAYSAGFLGCRITAAENGSGNMYLERIDTGGTNYTFSANISSPTLNNIGAGAKTLSGQSLSELSIDQDTGDFDNGAITIRAFKEGVFTP